MSQPSITKLKEFDVTQKIIVALSNACNRAILFSVKSQAKDVTRIAQELQLSPSTVYKSLASLEDLALVVVDQFVINGGKKIKQYKSRIGKVEITMEDMQPVLNLYPNTLLLDDSG